MHIVMISDVETQGGAALAASRLAHSLVENGQRVTRLVAVPDGRTHVWETEDVSLQYPLPWPARLQWHAQTQTGRVQLTQRLAREKLARRLRALRPDVINAHNLHFTFQPRWSPEWLGVCASAAPTVWTLHDMWSFTGRCVYSYDCHQFVTGCDATCPTASEYPALAPTVISHAWEERRRLLQPPNDYPLSAVCPSAWLARAAQSGLWQGRRVEVIPYGLSLEIFRPLDRTAARRALGLAPTDWVLLFAAQNLADPRKGWPLLKAALTQLSHHPITLLTMGNDVSPTIAEQLPGVTVLPCTHVADERQQALIYNAADALVHPAPQDNAPLVVMEALACGTPVVAFAVGGVPEMVISEQTVGTEPTRWLEATGWLADEVSATALARALDSALAAGCGGPQRRAACRAFAEARFDAMRQARQYAMLFQDLLH